MFHIPERVQNARLEGFPNSGLSSFNKGNERRENELDEIAAKNYPKYIQNIEFSTYINNVRLVIPGEDLDLAMKNMAALKNKERAVSENQEYLKMLCRLSAKVDFYAEKVFGKGEAEKLDHEKRVEEVLPGISKKAKNYLVKQLKDADSKFGFYSTDRKAENTILVEKSVSELAKITKQTEEEVSYQLIPFSFGAVPPKTYFQEITVEPKDQKLGMIDFKSIKYISLQQHLVELVETAKPWMYELEKAKPNSFFGTNTINNLTSEYLNSLIEEQQKNTEYKPLAFNIEEFGEEMLKENNKLGNLFRKQYKLITMLHGLRIVDRAIRDQKNTSRAEYIIPDLYNNLVSIELNMLKAKFYSGMLETESQTEEEREIFSEIKMYISKNYRLKEIDHLKKEYQENYTFANQDNN